MAAHRNITPVISLSETCKHPASKRYRDPETGEVFCKECANQIPTPRFQCVTSEKFGRGPTNNAVFGSNMRPTSKRNGERGPEKSHLHAVASVYGRRDGSKLPLKSIMKTCRACQTQQPLPVFGDSVFCQNEECGIELGHFVLRDLSYIPGGKSKVLDNNGLDCHRAFASTFRYYDEQSGEYLCRKCGAFLTNRSMKFWADLRILQKWDPVEDDPLMKRARELFSKEVLGRIPDEEAHELATRFLKGVKRLAEVHKKEIQNLLDDLLLQERIIAR